MKSITKTLLSGAALCALAAAPAMARNVPHFNVTALHAGNVVNKTRIHSPGRQHLTYTFAVYSSVSIPASDLDKKVKVGGLVGTNAFGCGVSAKFKAPKKSTYGKVGIYTETYSDGCSSGPTVFYGQTYKLTNPAGEGHTDTFTSSMIYKFKNNGVKFKVTESVIFDLVIGE
jgi:hypothetical protein